MRWQRCDGKKETRSFEARRGAISRKHQIRKLRGAVDRASDACSDIRKEIAKAPANSSLAVAIKLALWAYGDELSVKESRLPLDDEEWFDIIETAALLSVYEHAAAACGFDPLATACDAMHNK
jgi:hypothetical protein